MAFVAVRREGGPRKGDLQVYGEGADDMTDLGVSLTQDVSMDDAVQTHTALSTSMETVNVRGVDSGEDSRSVSLRKVSVPPNRVSALKRSWMELIEPLTKEMKLAVMYRPQNRQVFLAPAYVIGNKNNKQGHDNKQRDDEKTSGVSEREKRLISTYLEKAVEYVRAFLCGFDLKDSMALLRLDDIYLQTFSVVDVKRLGGDNLSRAIGRVVGKDGKTRNALMNSTRTRIVVEDKKIHLMGGSDNIQLARDSICSLILGSPPNKVYQHLNVVSRRMKERA